MTDSRTNGRPRLGEILTRAGHVSTAQIEEALGQQRSSGDRLGRCLRRLGHVSEEALLDSLHRQLRLPRVALPKEKIPSAVIELLPREFVARHCIVPISVVQLASTGGVLRIATSEPGDRRVVDDIRLITGLEVEEVLSSAEEIQAKIAECYEVTVERVIEGIEPAGAARNGELRAGQTRHDIEVMANEPTVVNLVNAIIAGAIGVRASDIHLVPFEKAVELRYRIDGILELRPPPPLHLHSAIVSRVKIMAEMDIAERFVPQDGHFQIHHRGAQVDVRVGTMPTIHGESVVLRLLEKSARVLTPVELGLDAERSQRLLRLVEKPHGLFLATGPTGSGKTTTLYAILGSIYTPARKTITIEDPVEYELAGVAQIPVRPARGLSFAEGLRSILRQDPDVIMVGEIRDVETAEIAIRAALTGHMVFSTLHTNDAAGAVTRLLDMGVEPFLIASSLDGVLAQRLARRICTSCRKPARPDPQTLERVRALGYAFDGAEHCSGAGCDDCRSTGYRGRTGLFELLEMTATLRALVLERRSAAEIQAAAQNFHAAAQTPQAAAQTPQAAAQGAMTTLQDDGLRKAQLGITTLEEVLRVALVESPRSATNGGAR